MKEAAMGEILTIGRLKIHAGKVEEYKRLAAKCMEIVRTKDSGTLQYDLFFNEDETEVVAIERFASSQALLEHAANLGSLMDAIFAIVEAEGELLGEPSAELSKAVQDKGVRIFSPYQSM
jgi:quinol monooxygenase YgiN